MAYKSTKDCVLDLEKHGHLIRIPYEVDPDLEMAEIHRRVFQAAGPAIFYEKVKGSPFPAVSNLYGTIERSRFLFRHTLENVKKMVRLKAGGPAAFFRAPLDYLSLPFAAIHALPQKVSSGPVFENKTNLGSLPQIKSWPKDGGPFILLPQVYTENQDRPGIMGSNLGMYRIQIAGNQYQPDKEAGLHYQIRRDIGIHHAAALRRNEPLRVSVFVGGPPAHAFAAVMYLPEGLSEVAFAGALAGRRFRYMKKDGFTLSADADFCITGFVEPGITKPEGPFGDHLGYYSLQHEFPVLKVESVYHRAGAIWPFTVVGRPPQEDSSFGKLIQEIAGPMVSVQIPGVKAVHAVDAAGVHPLLLAIGSERYLPYKEREPQEILAQANAILGFGPLSLAKYLMITAAEDNPALDVHDVAAFWKHFLERVDWRRDLHFHTRTTIDTLDYSGSGLNAGSKVVMAAAGNKKRDLMGRLLNDFKLPENFSKPKFAMPGVLIIQGRKFSDYLSAEAEIGIFSKLLEKQNKTNGIPLIAVADESEFTAGSLNNFLWTVFTRSNPSHDIYGEGSFTEHKHWGCSGALIIDARAKPHHAPPLEEDAAITKKVEALAAPGGPLHGIF